MVFGRVAILCLPAGSTHITGRNGVGCAAHMEENCGLNFVKLSSWVTACHVMKFCRQIL